MEQTSSTKQLKQVLGFWDLMGAAVGQIIGAGIMTLLGSAIAMTGRSVPLAFLVAFVIVVCQYAPLVFISGTVRLRGGNYTMISMLAGQKMAGVYSVIFFFSNLSLSMYALSFASYFISLFGIGTEQTVGFVVLTLFFVLNCLGIDKFAKVQNLIVGLLLIALLVFAVAGISGIGGGGGIDPNYFAEKTWMTGGVMGLLQAGGLLVFATGGGNTIVNLSAEAKRPTRDIPLAMVISTLTVAVVYGIIAFVAAGVLPLDQVANENLTIVANEILPYPIYVFFIICGAGFALISTLNAQFAWATKPTMQACDDGWLPKGLAKLSKWNTPIVILGLLYVLGVICILTGLSVAVLGNICLIATGVATLMVNAFLWKLPRVVPEEWKASKFRVSNPVLIFVSIIGSLAAIFNIYLNASTLSATLIVVNVIVIVAAFVFAFCRSKYVHMDVSYEKI